MKNYGIHAQKTFEIYFEVEDAVTPDDYFFVDDLIALPIQVLNRKGYTTVFCCAGHPFARSFQDEVVLYSDPIEYRREYYEMNYESYIMFHESVISLPEMPRGFYQQVNAVNDCLEIRKHYDYDGMDVYGMMHVVVESMKQLYEWTLNIPEYADYIQHRKQNGLLNKNR